MSISLKTRCADEIAAAMSQALSDEEFVGQFTKQASSAHEEAVRGAIAKGDKDLCVSMYNTYFGGGQGDTELQRELKEKYGDDKAMSVTNELRGTLYKICNPGPGESIPMAANDECQECGENPQMEVALGFAMDHLVKVADALDGRGFSNIASVVDEALDKLAAKKTNKKGEKPPKGAEHKAPKGWWKKMEGEIKEKNPDYSAKRVREIVGDIWDNELTDKKRASIVKKYAE